MPSTAKREKKKRFLEDKLIIFSHNKKRCFLCIKVQEETERKRAVVASAQVVIDFFSTYFTLKESLIITAGPCMEKKIKDDNLVPGSPEDWTSSPLSPVAGRQRWQTVVATRQQRRSRERPPRTAGGSISTDGLVPLFGGILALVYNFKLQLH